MYQTHDAAAAPFARNAHDAVIRYRRRRCGLFSFASFGWGLPTRLTRIDEFSVVVAHGILYLRQARLFPLHNAQRDMPLLCIFCGAHAGRDGRYLKIAADAARSIVEAGFGIVYGGGRVGLMGAIADAALAAGGEVVGIIPESLSSAEVAHHGITKLHVVHSMHERKALMAEISDGFIALPGGFGTMDEFCEILTWRQLRIHDKPIGLLNVDGYYDDLLALFDRMTHEGFLMPQTRGLFVTARTIDELLSEAF